MIVREVFFGRHRFEEMHQDLGIARNTLTNRLSRLVDEGVLERRSYGESGLRTEYHLTKAGLDLHHVLIALIEWGTKWRPFPGGPTTLMIHSCGHATNPVLSLRPLRRARRARATSISDQAPLMSTTISTLWSAPHDGPLRLKLLDRTVLHFVRGGLRLMSTVPARGADRRPVAHDRARDDHLPGSPRPADQ